MSIVFCIQLNFLAHHLYDILSRVLYCFLCSFVFCPGSLFFVLLSWLFVLLSWLLALGSSYLLPLTFLLSFLSPLFILPPDDPVFSMSTDKKPHQAIFRIYTPLLSGSLSKQSLLSHEVSYSHYWRHQ